LIQNQGLFGLSLEEFEKKKNLEMEEKVKLLEEKFR